MAYFIKNSKTLCIIENNYSMKNVYLGLNFLNLFTTFKETQKSESL